MSCWPKHLDCPHREYVGKPCTLAGNPAKVTLSPEGYARIAPLDSTLGAVEYSWTAVYNVFANRAGNFDG